MLSAKNTPFTKERIQKKEINFFNMHIVRKIVFAALILFGLILIGIWGLGRFGASIDADLEAVFPKDASVVMIFDYSDSGQRAAFKNLLKKFPETGGWAKIVEMLDSDLEERNISYEKDIRPVLKKKWEIGIAVNFEEGSGIESADLVEDTVGDSAENSVEIYVAGKFAQADKVQKIFEKILIKNYGEDYEGYEEHDDFKYWNPRPDDDSYLVRYGDLFFITNKEQYRDAAVERIKNNSGFKTVEEKVLMYTSINFKNLGAFFEAIFYKAGLGEFYDSIGDIGKEYSTIIADEGGFKFYGESEFVLGEEKEDGLANYNYEVGLYKKIGGDNVMLYSEQSKLGVYGAIVVQNFMEGFNSASMQEVQGSDIPQELFIPNYYENFVAQVAGISGLSFENVEVLLERPFAFAVSNDEDILPSVVIAVDVGEENEDNAKKLIAGVDNFVSEVIIDYDAVVMDITGGEVGVGAFKRENIVIGGGSFYKVWFDKSVLSEDALVNMNWFGILIENIDFEIYYGVTGDNLIILALYPGFEDVYGKSSLSENEDFMAASAQISGVRGHRLEYMNLEEFAVFFHKFLEEISYKNLLAVPFRARYEQYVEPILKTSKYVIGIERLEGEIVKAESYLKIGP